MAISHTDLNTSKKLIDDRLTLLYSDWYGFFVFPKEGDKMNLQDRVRMMFKNGVTVSAFCSSVGISTVDLFNWLNRGIELPDDTLDRIKIYIDRLC